MPFRIVIAFLLLLPTAWSYLNWEFWIFNTNLDPYSPAVEFAKRLNGAAVWMVTTYLLVGLLDRLVWQWWHKQRHGHALPALLRGVIAGLLYLVAGGCVVLFVFERSLTVLLAATGGAGIVVGFALQALILDFFAGLVISVQRPFKKGDLVIINDIKADVHDINWRVTQVLGSNQELISIPNHVVAKSEIVNLTSSGPYLQKFEIALDYDVPVERATRILDAAALAGQLDMPDGVHVPRVDPFEMREDGVNYRIRFWVPSGPQHFDAVEKMLIALQRHLSVAGLRPVRSRFYDPSSFVDVDAGGTSAIKRELLDSVSLFAPLSEEERAAVVDGMQDQIVKAGQNVVTAGDAGNSMFLILEGLVGIYIPSQDTGGEIRVATLQPGQYFGEMSLVTGEPRSATVRAETDCRVYRIEAPVIEVLLKSRQELVQELAQVIAERRVGIERARQQHADTELQAKLAAQRSDLAGKILKFFGMGKAAASA